MALGLVEGADALFEGEEGFVDLSSINPSLLIRVLYISPSLRPSQINKRHFPHRFFPMLKLELKNRMGSRRVHIGPSRPGNANRGAYLNNLQHRMDVHGPFFRDSNNIDLFFPVHPQRQLFSLIQQVIQLPTVDLKK